MPISIPCPIIPVVDAGLCVTLPGGAEVCVAFPGIVPPSASEMVRQLMAQMSAAMAPLQPFFNILDVVLAIFETIKALATLNPVKIGKAVPKLAEAIAGILKLIPQVSLIALVAGLLDMLILFLQGLKTEYEFQLRYIEKIVRSETLLGTPGTAGLQDIIDCANGNQDTLLLTMNEGNKPIATIIGIVNLFLEIIGLGKFKIPDLGDATVDTLQPAIDALCVTIDVLTTVRQVVPF